MRASLSSLSFSPSTSARRPALNIAVNLLLFPLYSLIYNLFVPFLLLGSLIIGLLGIPFPFLHIPNALYTEIILQLTAHAPPPLTIHSGPLPSLLPIFWIATLLIQTKPFQGKKIMV